MFRRSILVAFCAVFSIGVSAAEPADWKLISQGPDYQLFSKPSEGSPDLVAFRLTGVIEGTPKEVATAILDRDHRKEWMRDVRDLRTVRLPATGSVVEYTWVKTPFIIKDRDFVIRTDVEVDRKTGRVVITSKSVTEAEVPETSAVRGELTEGKFVMETGDRPGITKFTADMDVDPKGSCPRWIVNSFQKNWPIGMFRSLKWFMSRKVATLPPDFSSLFESRLDPQGSAR